MGWSPGHVQRVLRLLAAVPLTSQPQPLGSREGQLCGPWVGGHGLVFQTGHAGAPWGRRGPLGAEGGLLLRGAAPDKALRGEAGAGWGPGSEERRWWRSEPKGGSGAHGDERCFLFSSSRGRRGVQGRLRNGWDGALQSSHGSRAEGGAQKQGDGERAPWHSRELWRRVSASQGL